MPLEDRAGLGTYLAMFLVTFATLTYEVLLTRIFSVMTWYHFAFVAVSIALFGMTAGALSVHLRPEAFGPSALHRQLSRYSIFFAVAIVVSSVAQLYMPFPDEPSLYVPLRYLVTAIPFYCSGVCVALVLTSFRSQVSRLYAADLVGAAFGSISIIWLLDAFDGVTAMLAVGVAAGLGAVAFSFGSGPSRRPVVRAVLVTAAITSLVGINHVFEYEGRAPLAIQQVKGVTEEPYELELWNSHSRVVVRDEPLDAPVGWSWGSKLPEDASAEQKSIVIDGSALTVMTRFQGDLGAVDYLAYDATNAVHNLRSDADVFVVGSGGGRDVLSSLVFGQRSVTAVELNNEILDALKVRYGDFTGHLDQQPAVRLVNDEARSWLTRTEDRFDIIQISLIDTWAASSAGAFALSENSLYTADAWEMFLDRLDERGIFSVSWWQAGAQPVELYRLLGLANHALRQRGVSEPIRHMLMVSSVPSPGLAHPVATLLVSPDPFDEADRERLAEAAERYGYGVTLSSEHADDPVAESIASARSDAALSDSISGMNADLTVPTDDRPFFFLTSKFSNIFNPIQNDTFLGSRGQPVSTLFGLLLTTLLATAVLIAWPLIKTRDRMPAGLGTPLVSYFAGIGFGFLLIEISQLQRLTIFLGHPTYALAVVLFTFLLFSGIGSFASNRVIASAAGWARHAPLIGLVAMLVLFDRLTPLAIDTYAASTTPVRIAVAVALLSPIAFLMGMPFPVGITSAGERGGPTVLLWAVNGATSVVATVLAIALSLNFGISAAYRTGAFFYVLAALALAAVLRHPESIEPGEQRGDRQTIDHGEVAPADSLPAAPT